MIGSLMIVIGRDRRWRGILALSATVLLAVAVAGIATPGLAGGRFGVEAKESTARGRDPETDPQDHP